MAEDSDEDRQEKVLHNQPYDEYLDVKDADEVASQYIPTPRVGNQTHEDIAGREGSRIGNNSRNKHPAMSDDSDQQSDDDVNMGRPGPAAGPPRQPGAGPQAGMQPGGKLQPTPVAGLQRAPPPAGGSKQGKGGGMDEEEEDDDEDDTGSSEEDDESQGVEGAYNPAEYENLAVPPEIKELFQYITRYTPQTMELDHKLKPFIPDYIPAVGDIDAFIKIPRPDSKNEGLGVSVLDEPSTKQTDPTVLNLQLHAVTKQSVAKDVNVRSLDNAEKNPKMLDKWIDSIRDLHKSKPAPTVHYAKSMPDIEFLMQEWPPEFEELLKDASLPTAELECDLKQYVDMILSILDIPVHKSRVQSLHVLFSLFNEFKSSQHFQSLAAKPVGSGDQSHSFKKSHGGGDDADRLII